MSPRTTLNELDVDEDGLHALVVPRDDVLLEDLESVDPAGHDFHFVCAEGPFVTYDRTVHADRLDGGGYHVREEIVWDVAIPLWGALFRPLVARQLRRTGPPEVLDEDQAARRAPWWSPPARLDARSAAALLGDPERVRLWSELLRLDAESLERAGLAVRALPLRGRADALRATLPADAGTGNAAAASDVT